MAVTNNRPADLIARRLVARAVFVIFAAGALVGCSLVQTDNCSVAHQLAEEKGGLGCEIAKSTRETLYSGDDYPRLWTGEEKRKESNIDVSAVNAIPRRDGRGGSYDANLRAEEPSPRNGKLQSRDRKNGADEEDGEEGISFNFDRAPLPYFLKQMLGGALGVNYIAPDDLTGTVTFSTEKPIPKSRALPVIRDILARSGLRMRLLNGVYHIEASESAKGTASNGAGSDENVRTIDTPHGNAGEIAKTIRQIVPEGVEIAPSRTGDAIVVRGAAVEIDQVAELISAFSKSAGGEDRVSIIPLQQVGPTTIATRLLDFYRQRLAGSGSELPTIIPLENQQSILVGSRDPQMIASVKRLVRELDRNGDIDMPTVRIVPLTHLSAADVTKSITTIFGASGGGGQDTGGNGAGAGGGGGAGSGGGGAGGRSASANANSGAMSSDGPDGGQYGGNGGDSGQGGGSQSGAGGDAPAPAGGGGMAEGVSVSMPGGGSVRIVADTRSNAVMVYSNYAMFKRVREILRTLDVPQAQVVIEGTIAEVRLTDDLQFGVQAFLQGAGIVARSGSDAVAPTTPSGKGLFAAVGGSFGGFTATAVIQALQSVTQVKVISSPYITVLDGKTARLMIGDQIPYSMSSQSSTSNLGGGTTLTQSIQVKDTGIVLEVTPRINPDNAVVLTIDQSVSTPAASAAAGNLMPIIATRQVKSDVLTQSGRTILLAGLIQDRLEKGQDGIPLISTVPGVVDLFKTQSNKEDRTEMLIMMTPRVVRQSPQIEQITRLFRDQLHTH